MSEYTYYVYILDCYDKKGKSIYYRGYTNNLRRRLKEHKAGRGGRTTKRFNYNISLLYTEEILSKTRNEGRAKARKREQEIKSWGRRKVEQMADYYHDEIEQIKQRNNIN